jgi:hypothetical protein
VQESTDSIDVSAADVDAFVTEANSAAMDVEDSAADVDAAAPDVLSLALDVAVAWPDVDAAVADVASAIATVVATALDVAGAALEVSAAALDVAVVGFQRDEVTELVIALVSKLKDADDATHSTNNSGDRNHVGPGPRISHAIIALDFST